MNEALEDFLSVFTVKSGPLQGMKLPARSRLMSLSQLIVMHLKVLHHLFVFMLQEIRKAFVSKSFDLFSTSELEDIIKALFEDSSERKSLLKLIQISKARP